jgi:hypothetical protein
LGWSALPLCPSTPCADKLTAVKVEIDKAADAKKKEAADAHYKMADDAMKAKDEKGCLEHLGMAEAALK